LFDTPLNPYTIYETGSEEITEITMLKRSS
jgi:hypothetical protein